MAAGVPYYNVIDGLETIKTQLKNHRERRIRDERVVDFIKYLQQPSKAFDYIQTAIDNGNNQADIRFPEEYEGQPPEFGISIYQTRMWCELHGERFFPIVLMIKDC